MFDTFTSLLNLFQRDDSKNKILFWPTLFFFKGNSKAICGALRDLAPFVQFKKREKHPWRSVTFSKVPGFKKFGRNLIYSGSLGNFEVL